jgi:hypothetical protein
MRRQDSPAGTEVDLERDEYVDGEDNDVFVSERVCGPAPNGTSNSAPGTRRSGSFEIG